MAQRRELTSIHHTIGVIQLLNNNLFTGMGIIRRYLSHEKKEAGLVPFVSDRNCRSSTPLPKAAANGR